MILPLEGASTPRRQAGSIPANVSNGRDTDEWGKAHVPKGSFCDTQSQLNALAGRQNRSPYAFWDDMKADKADSDGIHRLTRVDTRDGLVEIRRSTRCVGHGAGLWNGRESASVKRAL
jgi:hypothetical protein